MVETATDPPRPIVVQGKDVVSTRVDAVPVLDADQLIQAVNFLRCGCPAVQVTRMYSLPSLPERFDMAIFLRRENLEQRGLFRSFLEAVKQSEEEFEIYGTTQVSPTGNAGWIVLTVTRTSKTM
jgi:hypothetical protein